MSKTTSLILTREKAIDLVDHFNGKKVIVIGDIMLDHYVLGNVDRISPEAPVPVVKVREEKYVLGGAANVAANIKELGGKPLIVGGIGKDTNAEIVKSLFKEREIETNIFECMGCHTTVKTRIIGANQQIVRVDKESSFFLEAQQMENVIYCINEFLDEDAVVIISDYGKGFISGDLIDRIRKLDTKNMKIKILVDPKPKNFKYYVGVDLVTPNIKEAGEGAGFQIENKSDVLKAGLKIFELLKCQNVLITMGAQGMALFRSPDEAYHIPTAAKKVFDVSGAGDTVISVISLALASGIDLASSCVLANHAAGIVVGQIGTATVSSSELKEVLLSTKFLYPSPWE